MDTAMIVMISIALLAIGMVVLRRAFWSGQVLFTLGVVGFMAAVPAFGDFATTVVYGFASGVDAFIAQF